MNTCWSQARLAKSIQRDGVDAGGNTYAVGPILSRYRPTGSDCGAGCAETR